MWGGKAVEWRMGRRRRLRYQVHVLSTVVSFIKKIFGG